MKKRTFIFAIALSVVTLCLLSQISSVAAAAGYNDEFSGSSINSFWTTAGSSSATYSLTANPGYMRITCPANLDIGGSNDNAPRLIQSVTGDFVATTKVSGTFTAAGTHAGLIVWKDSTHFVRVERRDVNKVQIGGKNGGSFTSTQYNLGSNVDPTYLELEKIGSTINGYWSSDGATWHLFGTFTLTATDPVSVGLFVINQNASPPTLSADFDYFHISPNTPPPPSTLPENPLGVAAVIGTMFGAFALYSYRKTHPKAIIKL